MNYDEFKIEIMSTVSEKLGDGYQVTINEVLKTNSVKLYGMVIREKGQNIAPTIYLESFYEAYTEGKELDTLGNEIVNIYERSKPIRERSFDFFRDYENVKENLCLKIINKSNNEEMLNEVPGIDFLDLVAVPYCTMIDADMGHISIPIRNEHIKMWGMEKDEVLEYAKDNTIKKLGLEVTPISDIIKRSYPNLESHIEMLPEDKMFVLTNRNKTYGAVNIIYEDVLSDFSKAADSDFYILPSSVHEVIIFLHDSTDGWDQLDEMVREVNSACLLKEEVLSDHAYFYSREKGTLIEK